MQFPLVTLEEHFVAPSIRAEHEHHYSLFPQRILDAMADIGTARIGSMDAGGVKKQVVSHGPGCGSPEACRKANDLLASAVREHPTRFAAFATLPMDKPQESAVELRRCVKELGFVGALIENTVSISGQGDTFYDASKHLVFWEEAEALDVPIYLHPAFPSDELSQLIYAGNYSDTTQVALGAFGFGWQQVLFLS